MKRYGILACVMFGLVGCAPEDWPPSFEDMQKSVKGATDHGTSIAVTHFDALSKQIAVLGDAEQRQAMASFESLAREGVQAGVEAYAKQHAEQKPSNAGLLGPEGLGALLAASGLGGIFSRLFSKSGQKIEKTETKVNSRVDTIEATIREKLAMVEAIARKAEQFATATAINDEKTKVQHTVG